MGRLALIQRWWQQSVRILSAFALKAGQNYDCWKTRCQMLWLGVSCWLQDARVPSEAHLWARRPWQSPGCEDLIASDTENIWFSPLSFISPEVWSCLVIRGWQEDTQIVHRSDLDLSMFVQSQCVPSAVKERFVEIWKELKGHVWRWWFQGWLAFYDSQRT